MEVEYEEIGEFDAEKAAKGLIDLYNKLKHKKDKENNNGEDDPNSYK